MRKLETILGELLKLVPRYEFEKAVQQYQGDRYVKSYTTWRQYITILFSQIKQKDSIRDIVTGWGAFASRWYHLGMGIISRSTFSDAHNRRDYRIFESLFYHLLSRCKDHTPKHRFKFKNPLYSLDASVIDLVPVGLSLGQVSEDQGSDQDALPLRPFGGASDIRDNHGWQEA